MDARTWQTVKEWLSDVACLRASEHEQSIQKEL
jgi:hypothetical protein